MVCICASLQPILQSGGGSGSLQLLLFFGGVCLGGRAGGGWGAVVMSRGLAGPQRGRVTDFEVIFTVCQQSHLTQLLNLISTEPCHVGARGRNRTGREHGKQNCITNQSATRLVCSLLHHCNIHILLCFFFSLSVGLESVQERPSAHPYHCQSPLNQAAGPLEFNHTDSSSRTARDTSSCGSPAGSMPS